MPKFDHWFSRRCPTKLSELFATTTTWSWQWGRQRSPMTPPLRRLPRSSWPGPARPAATSPPAYMSVDCHPPAYDATPSSATKINDFVRYRFSRQHFGQASLIGRTWRRLVRDFQLICDKLRPVPWRRKDKAVDERRMQAGVKEGREWSRFDNGVVSDWYIDGERNLSFIISDYKVEKRKNRLRRANTGRLKNEATFWYWSHILNIPIDSYNYVIWFLTHFITFCSEYVCQLYFH